jgi:hypothetical protein
VRRRVKDSKPFLGSVKIIIKKIIIKSLQETLRTVKVKSSDAVSYDPKVGFKLQLDKLDEPEGTYVCTGRYGSLVRGVEYTVKSHFANTQQQGNYYFCFT